MVANVPEATAQAVLNHLMGMLVRGEISPGGELPDIGGFAKTLNVSDKEMREALRNLSILGIVESRPVKGNKIYHIPAGSGMMMFTPLLVGMLIDQKNSNDLYELRLIIEVGALKLAIEKADGDDIQALSDSLKKYHGRMAEGDTESLVELDRLFHRQILETSNNPLLILLGTAVSELFALPLTRALNSWGPQQILENHTALFEAIAGRDVQKATALITAAFEKTKKFF